MGLKNSITNIIKKTVSNSKKKTGVALDEMSVGKSFGFMKKVTGFLARLPVPAKIALASGTVAIALIGVAIIVANTNGSNIQNTPAAVVCSTDQSSTSTTDVSGDWTKDGTSANKVAKEIWDYWNDKGYSASAIAGVLGNVYSESGFVPYRAQGGGTMMSDTPVGGGGGLYQFTPYTKYAEIGSEKWNDVKAQNDFVWNSEAKGFSDYSTITDVEEATTMWFKLYERGAAASAHMDTRIAAAKKAYEMWGSTASQSGSSTVISQSGGTADSNIASVAAEDANTCQTSDNTVDGSIAKLFDDKYNGLVLNAGLDDPNHTGIGGTVGVHGPGSHDGWDLDPASDPGGTESEAIYAIAGGTIEGIGRGKNGGLLFVNIKLSNGNFLQYQEFKYDSVPDDLQKGQSIKAGTKIGEIGNAGASGGIHYGSYVHITYSDSSTPVNSNGGIESWGATKHTLSLGDLLGIKADKWVHGTSQKYTWSDMTALTSSKD